MKKSQAINILTFATVIIGGAVLLAYPGSPRDNEVNGSQTQNDSVLSAAVREHDFGTISMREGKVSRFFEIDNSSQETVEVKEIYTSCMCTDAFFLNGDVKQGPFGMPGHALVPKVNEKIEPTDRAQIEVVFDPAAHGPAGIGPIERSVFIVTSKGLPLELVINAEVIP